MFDACEKDAITTAFEIVAQGNPCFEINGYTFNVADGHDQEILNLLVLSPMGNHLARLRDMLDEALDAPEPSPFDEVLTAQGIFRKQLEAGLISEVTTENGQVYIRYTE